MEDIERIQKAINALAKYANFMTDISPNGNCRSFYDGMVHACDKINDFIERNITNDKNKLA